MLHKLFIFTGKLWLLFYLILLIGCGDASPDLNVFVIVVNGMRTDRFQMVSTPNMDYLTKKGAVSYNNRVSVPSQARVNAVTIPTGAHSDKHGIVGASYYDDNMNLIHTARPTPEIAQENVLVPTLFEVLEQKNVKSAYFAARGHETMGGRGASITFGGEHNIPSYIWDYRYEETIEGSQEEAVKRKLLLDEFILEKITNAVKEDGVNFFIANLGSLGYIAQTHGPRTKYYDTALSQADKRIGEFISFLEKQNIYKDSVLIVTSGHGFTQVRNPQNVLFKDNSRSPVLELNNAGIRHEVLNRGGRAFSLYLYDNSQAGKAFRILRKTEWIRNIYSEHDIEGLNGSLSDLNYYFPGRSGDFFIDIKPTHTLEFPARGQYGSTAGVDMVVPLIFSGPGITENIYIGSSQTVDIAPNILAFYNLDYHNYLESDGKLLKNIFQ